MYDLKIMDSVNGTLSAQTWPGPDRASSIYSLVQQIFKCLLTDPGQDAFDPTYGSGLRSQILGLTGKNIDQARKIIGAAIQKVIADLTSGPQSDDPTEQLVDLQLISLEFDFNNTAWLVGVNVISAGSSVTTVLGV